MATKDLTPTLASSSTGAGWDSEGEAVVVDGLYAVCQPADNTDYLQIYGFGDNLPEDITIDGIEILVTGLSTATGTTFSVALSADGDYAWSAEKVTATFNVTPSTETVGGAADLWGLTPRVSDFRRNSNLAVWIRQTTAGEGGSIDGIVFRVHYTDVSGSLLLTGTRSSFPWTADESTIPVKTNGTSSTHQVRSEDVNLLGDCLLNIEIFANETQDDIRLIGPPNSQLTMYTLTVTGVITAPDDDLILERMFRLRRGTFSSNYTLTTASSGVERSPNPRNVIAELPLVSAVGWLIDGGVLTPLHVSPRAYLVRYVGTGTNPDLEEVYFGFTAVGLGTAGDVQTGTEAAVETSAVSSRGRSGIGYRPPPGAITGTYTIKVLAAGY